MFAWVKINAERNGVKDIQYSLGTDMTLDGRISYDTRTQRDAPRPVVGWREPGGDA